MQDDNGIEHPVTYIEALIRHVMGIKQAVTKDRVIVDEYDYDDGVNGTVTLSRRLRYPTVITHIAATWDTSATSVTLTLGDRTIPLPKALGFINIEGKFQLQARDVIELNAGANISCYLEVMGYVTQRKLND